VLFADGSKVQRHTRDLARLGGPVATRTGGCGRSIGRGPAPRARAAGDEGLPAGREAGRRRGLRCGAEDSCPKLAGPVWLTDGSGFGRTARTGLRSGRAAAPRRDSGGRRSHKAEAAGSSFERGRPVSAGRPPVWYLWVGRVAPRGAGDGGPEREPSWLFLFCRSARVGPPPSGRRSLAVRRASFEGRLATVA
jgi:hypothetical protein